MPEKLQEIILGRRFALAPDGGKVTVADTTIRAGETRRLDSSWAKPPQPSQSRWNYASSTRTDEFPFKGRELAAPTFATMIARDLDWQATPRCRDPAARRD